MTIVTITVVKRVIFQLYFSNTLSQIIKKRKMAGKVPIRNPNSMIPINPTIGRKLRKDTFDAFALRLDGIVRAEIIISKIPTKNGKNPICGTPPS
jgi:hypothetical protein